jgi:hypothetical protein
MPRLRSLLVIVAIWTVAGCAKSGPSRAWSYTFDAGSPEQLAKGREAARAFVASLGAAGLTLRNSASASRSAAGAADIHETTRSWRGDAFGLRDLEVVVTERDGLAEGPEFTVGLAAQVPTDDTQRSFRELSDRITKLFESLPR